jgi:hypothetical protein
MSADIEITAPAGWTRSEGFPKIGGGTGGMTLEDEFFVTWNLFNVFTNIPRSGSRYNSRSVVPEIRQLVFSRYAIRPSSNKGYAFVNLFYSTSDVKVESKDDDPKFWLENNTTEIPLEKKGSYLTCWNYDLWYYQDGTEITDPPAWWATATDREDATGYEEDGEYLWTQDNPGGKWTKLKDRTKPGVEAYRVPAPVVVEQRWYRDEKRAGTAAQNVGFIVTPAETFGIVSGEWLLDSATVEEDGRRYLVTFRYVWASNWDDDLYSVPGG